MQYVGLQRIVRRLKNSFAWRCQFAKHQAFKRFANRQAHEYQAGRILFHSGTPFDLNKWIFHDENWTRVQHRRQHRALVSAGAPLNITDNYQEPTNELTVSAAGDLGIDAETTPDKWIYLYLDPRRYHWNDYSWVFTVCRRSYFRELQFGFRYQDFYNRYRYRFEADRIFFDKVVKGRFYLALNSTPFRMELGVSYDVQIDAFRNHFRCYINGVLMSKDYDFDNTFPTGSIALILWEDNGTTDIRATIGPMSVHKLERVQ